MLLTQNYCAGNPPLSVKLVPLVCWLQLGLQVVLWNVPLFHLSIMKLSVDESSSHVQNTTEIKVLTKHNLPSFIAHDLRQVGLQANGEMCRLSPEHWTSWNPNTSHFNNNCTGAKAVLKKHLSAAQYATEPTLCSWNMSLVSGQVVPLGLLCIWGIILLVELDSQEKRERNTRVPKHILDHRAPQPLLPFWLTSVLRSPSPPAGAILWPPAHLLNRPHL